MGAQQFTTTVLPGHRIELSAPELAEGQTVNVIVVPAAPMAARREGSLLELLESLPPGPRGAKSWDEIEQQFQMERDSWDR